MSLVMWMAPEKLGHNRGGVYMFEFLAPMSGKVISLSQVPDKIFASKMAGEGVAIEPIDDVVVAPADGELSLILEANHAFCMKLDNGIVIVVHIGVDTVELKGEGFERLIQHGVRVKAGDPIIKLDREKILSKGYSLATPVLITNMEIVSEKKYNLNAEVVAGKDVIMSYNIK